MSVNKEQRLDILGAAAEAAARQLAEESGAEVPDPAPEPPPEPKAEAATPAAEPPPPESDDSGRPESEGAVPKETFKKRIDQLGRQRDANAQDAAYWKGRAEELARTRTTEAPAVSPPPAEDDDELDPFERLERKIDRATSRQEASDRARADKDALDREKSDLTRRLMDAVRTTPLATVQDVAREMLLDRTLSPVGAARQIQEREEKKRDDYLAASAKESERKANASRRPNSTGVPAVEDQPHKPATSAEARQAMARRLDELFTS